MVAQEEQVATNHQGNHSEDHPQEARLVALLVARLEQVEVTTETMIPWERDNRRLEVGCQMLDSELPLSLWILDLEG